MGARWKLDEGKRNQAQTNEKGQYNSHKLQNLWLGTTRAAQGRREDEQYITGSAGNKDMFQELNQDSGYAAGCEAGLRLCRRM
jgi:hypothetical protein